MGAARGRACCSERGRSTPSCSTPTATSGSSTPASSRGACSRPRRATSRGCAACSIPRVPPATVAGLDLIRDADGELLVLEDNLRMPSGASLRARRARSGRAGARRRRRRPRRSDGYVGDARRGDPRRRARRRAPTRPRRSSPTAPRAAPGTSTAGSAASSGIPVVTPTQLEVDARPPLRPPSAATAGQLDVVYRRLDEDRLSAAGRQPDRARRAAAAGARSRAGCAASTPSAPALADDKLAHAYVEEHGPLLPRRGAAAALGPELRPLRRGRPRGGDGAARRAGDQAARRLRRPAA